VAGGFSLVEILVTVALMAFIILGLVAMFVQTQRAFKLGTSGADMLETGRAMTDLIAREVASARPTQMSNTVNFYVEIPQLGEAIHTAPLLQSLPGVVNPPQLRTNYLEPFFFMSQPSLTGAWPDRTWVGIGYYVLPDTGNAGVGTLYRYSWTNVQNLAPTVQNPLPQLFAPSLLFNGFANALTTLRTDLAPSQAGTVTRIADGIVHLRLRAFATNGFPIVGYSSGFNTYYGVTVLNNILAPAGFKPVAFTANNFNSSSPDNWTSLAFYSNAVPAFVELELGVLEQQAYQKYKTLDPSAVAGQVAFLSNRVAQVHVFRQRIALHNVDPAAYQ